MYPEIDLSRMLEHPRCAVRVTTQEQANAIIYNAQRQFPERISNSWDTANNYWSRYKEKTTYTLFYEGDNEPTMLSYGDVTWSQVNNYIIFEYEDLLSMTVEIIESDYPVNILLGVSV